MHDSDNKTPIEMCEFEFEGWTRDTSENTLDFTLDGRVRIRLNALDLSLMIMADQKTYIFAVDTWMSDNGHYAVRTRDGHAILFVDWAEVNDSKTRRNVQTFDLYN